VLRCLRFLRSHSHERSVLSPPFYPFSRSLTPPTPFLLAGWPFPTSYPCIAGHEVIGNIVRVGKNVKDLAIGDRVGVGAQGGACLECEWCLKGLEQHCDKGMKGTYQVRSIFPFSLQPLFLLFPLF
jgi:hypothetical protein